MFFDLKVQKVFLVCVLVALIIGSIVTFVFANALWNIIPQASYEIARNESAFLFWVQYELPDNSGAAIATSTPSGDAESIPVLVYHAEGGSSANMPLSVFVDQMRTLQENGWHTITMEQFDEWEKGEIQLPDKSFLLTFDGGREDTYYEADPVLQATGFNAVMFVVTGFSLPQNGRSSNVYLNETELADMVASGRWELGSYGDLDDSLYAVQSTVAEHEAASSTPGDFLSNKFWDTQTDGFETDTQFAERVEGDLESSKQTLEQDFGINVIAFAYPFNDYGEDSVNFQDSQAILDQIVPHVYTYAFYQVSPEDADAFNYPLANNGLGTTPYMIKRIEPDPTWTGQDLLNVLDADEAQSLPYETDTFGAAWVNDENDVTSPQNSLPMQAPSTASEAEAFLKGSGWWTNYYFSATVDWQGGSDVSLLARTSANEQYAACAFSSDAVEVEWRKGNVQTTLASEDYDLAGSPADIILGIGVSGNTITCYENGVAVVSSSAGAIPAQGGIAVEVWDKNAGVARATVERVSVSPDAPRSEPASGGTSPTS